MSGILIVFARRPEPGSVKTRLCPPLSPQQAADLYACMLDDVLEVSAAAARRHGIALGLAVHPPQATAELVRSAPAGTRPFPQRGDDLAARMAHAVEDAAAAGFAPILLRGSDSPTLAPERIGAALAALAHDDVVFCPDRDGGYALVGLRRPVPGLFAHAMSTSRVLEDTRARAADRGLTSACLEAGFDVDTAADLALLAGARERGEAALCPRTLAWLEACPVPDAVSCGREGNG